jgi:hypothetical protein
MKPVCKIITAIAMLFVTTELLAHARFLSTGKLKPRDPNAGIKVGPCGPAPRSATPVKLKAGEDLLVEWEETINHPGYFRISFSQEGDAGFGGNILATVQDTQNTQVNGASHKYSKSIKVPNVNCTTCTIQLIQYMTENPATPSLYFSCADIQIEGATADQPYAPPTNTPVPEIDQTKKECEE